MKRYIRSTESQDYRHLLAQAYYSKDPEELDKLAHDKRLRIVETVAANPNTSPETLDYLGRLPQVKYIKTVAAVAANPNTSEDTLRFIAEENGDAVSYCALAGNENIPIDILSKLAKHHDPDVRMRVAYNESTPEDILEMMAHLEDDDDVLQALANNSKCPREAFV